MTLAPLDSTDVVGVIGPSYRVGNRCSVPDCGNFAEHGHHIFRRSFLKGAYFWVRLPDGAVLGNLTGLCAPHHDNVTGGPGGHRNAIRLVEGTYWWAIVRGLDAAVPEFELVAPLDPQPPTPDLLDAQHQHDESESETCPTCGQKRRRAPSPPTLGERRRRKSWSVKVPDDEQEQGADVLDALVDDLAPLLGVEPTATGRYYVLVPVLTFAQLERPRFIETIKGVGG